MRSKRLDVAGRMATELRRLHDAAARGFVQPGYCQDSAALRTGLNNVLLKSSKLRQGQFDLGDQLSCRTMLCVVRHLVAAEHQSDILAVLLDHVASGLGEMPTWASTETRTSFDVNVTRGQGITSAALAELSRHPIAGQALGSVVVIALWPVSGASRPVYWHEMLITQAHGQSLWADVAIAHEGTVGIQAALPLTRRSSSAPPALLPSRLARLDGPRHPSRDAAHAGQEQPRRLLARQHRDVAHCGTSASLSMTFDRTVARRGARRPTPDRCRDRW